MCFQRIARCDGCGFKRHLHWEYCTHFLEQIRQNNANGKFFYPEAKYCPYPTPPETWVEIPPLFCPSDDCPRRSQDVLAHNLLFHRITAIHGPDTADQSLADWHTLCVEQKHMINNEMAFQAKRASETPDPLTACVLHLEAKYRAHLWPHQVKPGVLPKPSVDDPLSRTSYRGDVPFIPSICTKHLTRITQSCPTGFEIIYAPTPTGLMIVTANGLQSLEWYGYLEKEQTLDQECVHPWGKPPKVYS